MAYDEQLAARVRVLLKGQRVLVEKKMFDGLAYMSQGKIFAGVLKDNLAVRVGPRRNQARRAVAALARTRTGVHLGSTGGETKGSPPTRLTSSDQHA